MIVIDLYYNICKYEGNKLLALFILKQEYVQGMYVCIFIFQKKENIYFYFLKKQSCLQGVITTFTCSY